VMASAREQQVFGGRASILVLIVFTGLG
jgi:hypothetical protein